MVAPQQKKILRVFDLVGQQKHNALNGVFAPVHVVADEEVVHFPRVAPVLKYLEQILILAVNVPCLAENLPHILTGAYNSKSIGCSRNISRDLRHTVLIYLSSILCVCPQ